MNTRLMSGKRLSLVCRVVAAVAVVLALAVPASAGPIVNPDLTMFGLNLSWDGTTFSATGTGVVLSWTDAAGGIGVGSPVFGNGAIDWNGSAGTLSVSNSVLGLMLSGNLTGFSAILGPSPSVAQFSGNALLTTSILPGMGNDVYFAIGSTDFGPTAPVGTGDADVYPSAVPEPATLGLLGAGLGVLAARRRRARR